MNVGPRSLAFRVIAFSTVWAILALVVISTVISTLYRQASERGFDSLLSAHLFNLIGSVGVSQGGELTGAPDLGDLRFSEPRLRLVLGGRAGLARRLSGELRSASMTGRSRRRRSPTCPSTPSSSAATSPTGSAGEDLAVVESEFVLDSAEPRRALSRDGQPHRARGRDRRASSGGSTPICRSSASA